RRIIYRLPEVLTSNTVYIVEGEKDVDSLRAVGLTATCNPNGAGKWRSEYVESFKQHQHVIIIPDNDEPGRKHATQIAATLCGKVASIKIVELPNLLPKGDVSDWLNGGGNREHLEKLVTEKAVWIASSNIKTTSSSTANESSRRIWDAARPAADF